MRISLGKKPTTVFRSEYFSAKSRSERVVAAVGGIFHSLVMLVFVGAWTGMCASIFFPLILSGENSGESRLPVLFAGGFFCIGLCVLGYALFRLGSIIRTIFTAPPLGSVPAETPDSVNSVSGKRVFRLSGKTAFPRPDIEADFSVG